MTLQPFVQRVTPPLGNHDKVLPGPADTCALLTVEQVANASGPESGSSVV